MTLPAPATSERASFAEYLRREEKAIDRHEFHDGEILAMSGGTYKHSRASTNTILAIGTRLRGSSCAVLDSNIRVRQLQDRRYVYPDATVVCGEPEFDPRDPKQTTITNPQLVLEVLSDSTEAYDRGEKFNHYRRIDSLREYVLVAQDRPLVETFHRQEDGSWSLWAWEGIEAVARLRCLGIDLPLAEVYTGITFAKAPPAEAGEAEQAS